METLDTEEFLGIFDDIITLATSKALSTAAGDIVSSTSKFSAQTALYVNGKLLTTGSEQLKLLDQLKINDNQASELDELQNDMANVNTFVDKQKSHNNVAMMMNMNMMNQVANSKQQIENVRQQAAVSNYVTESRLLDIINAMGEQIKTLQTKINQLIDFIGSKLAAPAILGS